MIIYAKIGTMPARHVGVARKRKLPIVGEAFKVYEQLDARGRHERYQRPSGVLCTEIRLLGTGETLYFCDRF